MQIAGEEDEIIVFGHFDTGIDANIAKTKLDAHDIPCFLTEENIAGLYPGQQALAFRIRLHIFRKDIDRASQVLMVQHSQSHASDIHCPRCGSASIQRDFPKNLKESTFGGLAVLFFGVFLPDKKINHCLECDYEF